MSTKIINYFSAQEFSANLASSWHAQENIEGLIFLIKGVINNDNMTAFLSLILIKINNTGMTSRMWDVVRKRQDSRWYSTSSWTYEERN